MSFPKGTTLNRPEIGAKYGTLRVISGVNGKWTLICESCGKTKFRRANELMGPKAKRCFCQLTFKMLKVGDSVGDIVVVGPPEKGFWLVKCRCGKELRKRKSQIHGCGCGQKHYKLGEIVHGRKVVKLSTKKLSTITVECLSCGSHAKINPSLKPAKCRFCADWDGRMGAVGQVYAVVCPHTGEARYVGSTKGKSYRRVIGHFRDRNKKEYDDKPLYQWLRKLASEGSMPGTILLEKVSGNSLHEREIFWINKLNSEGYMLFNLEHLQGGVS